MDGIKGSLFFVVLLFLSRSLADTDFGEDAKFGNQEEHDVLGDGGDDQFFGGGVDENNVHYANDDPDGSGEDDDQIFIPVEPKKPILPKSRPKESEEEPETITETAAEDPDTFTETVEVNIEHTSFKPVEFNFEHKHEVLSGVQSTVQPGGEGEEPVTEGEPVPESEAKPEAKPGTVNVQTANIKTQHLPKGDLDVGEGEGHSDLADNGHYNETDVAVGQTTERTRNTGLSNIAKIGIAMGCVVLFWLLLCPIVCIVCRRRDKKREKRAEEFKLKNGVPHHQHPLVEELVLTELGQSEKHHSNGKQKLYGKDAQNAEELQPMKNQANGSHNGVVTKKSSRSHAPLASQEALDTEV